MHQTESITGSSIGSLPERNRELRSFGLLVGSAFLVIGLWPLLKQTATRNWSLLLAVILILPALLHPAWLRIPHAIWLKFATALGWFNTRLILGILYVVAVLPIAMLLRITGKTPLHLKFDKNVLSYREKPDSEDDQNVTQQF